mmetsp:Transcript_43048/g.136837  ORF Transcript_43048/g.136837 Transcript_43048/m.136837 type:complete len:386 (+) Transcript_43048:49-1206(+)
MPFCDKSAVLAAHNKLRSLHGAPPLSWSDECAVYAQRCANENSEKGRESHCFLKTDTTARRMGQSIYRCLQGAKQEVGAVVEAWYQEVGQYDFNSPSYQLGTSHFTALVWHDTTHVGMSQSQDGLFFVANYYPRGNVVGRASGKQEFQTNVLPPNTPRALRPRNKHEKELFGHFHILAKGRSKIPLKELRHLFERLGERQLLEAMADADLDGDGLMDPYEFAMAMVQPRDGENEKKDQAALQHITGFVRCDVDGNMCLDQKELKSFLSSRMCRQFTDKEVEKFLANFDVDANGLLDYGELCKLLDSGCMGKAFAEGGSVTFVKWDAMAASLLQDLPPPYDSYAEDVRKHVERGFAARVTKLDDTMLVELANPCGGWQRLTVAPLS